MGMIPLVLTAALLLAVPIILLVLFMSNAAIMFLAACTGLVLLSSLDPTVVTTAASVIPGESEGYIRLAVVMLSVAFAALILRGSIRKTSQLLLHSLVVVIMALMLWALVPDLTGISWIVESTEFPAWEYVSDFKSLIVAVGFSLSLLIVLRSKGHDQKSKGKH